MSKLDKFQEYKKWFISQYSALSKLEDLKKKSSNTDNDWLSILIENFSKKVSKSYTNLFDIYIAIKYYTIPKKTEYILSVFKLSRLTKFETSRAEYHTTYAFLYSYIDDGTTNIKHDYVCISPTFKSADGEYRRRFIRYDQFKFNINKYSKELEPIEKNILDQLKGGKITISTEIFVPDNDNKIIKNMKLDVDKNRLPIEFLVVMWVSENLRLKQKTYENHLAEGFHKAMFIKNDLVVLENLIKQYGIHKLEQIAESFDAFFRHTDSIVSNVYCGQKYIPLRVKEIEDPINIKYQPWREMYATSLVSDLVVNGISPSVPLLAHWFIIQANDKSMYDNTISQVKLDHSLIASEIVQEMEQSRSKTYNYVNNNEKYISYRMEGLSDTIELPMSFAEKEIIMSNNTLCFIMQHVGRTFVDIHTLTRNVPWFAAETGPVYEDVNVFSKYLFEYIYTLYSLNSKLGLMHGDLHLNNCTIYTYSFLVDRLKDNLPFTITNPHVIYDLSLSDQTDNLKDVYIFKHYGRTGCLIDFSRAFINKKRLEKDYKEKEVTNYMISQRKRLLKVFKKELPEFAEHHSDNIEIAMIENFDLFFKLFTALDSYKLTKGMLQLFRSEGIAVHEGITKLLNKVNGIAFQYLTTQMKKLFERNLKSEDEFEYPNRVIINECFQHCLVENYKPNDKDITLTDVFCYRNDVKYNMRNYDQFNPMIKYDYVIDNKIPIGLDKFGYQYLKDMIKYYKRKSEKERVKEIGDEVLMQKKERRKTPYVDPNYKPDIKPSEEEILRTKESEAQEIESYKSIIEEL